MKIAVVCFVVLIAYVSAESCRHTDECNLETCTGDGWSVQCHSGVCTCDHSDHTGGKCAALSDCSRVHCGHNFQAHCVDGMCRCSHHGGN